ncbi:ABC transporter substrate-binding protein [Aeromicrobium sp. CF3.5]|uniref:ABC transporter substrate-binding protein n=1 Tax=Aeromicrobium sp. CF3.5 TaxID=3373078 RepID=UPI003EE7A8FA
MRPTRPLAALVPLAALAAACGGAPEIDAAAAASSASHPVTIENCGFTTTVDALPERAITMNQGATEVMLALGLQDQLAGTAYLDDSVPPKWRAAYDSVEVLSTEYPAHEALLAVRPDFVYASYVSAFDAQAAGPAADLAELGIGSFTSPLGCGDESAGAEVSFETVWDEIDTVAEVFGVPDRAEAIRADQEEALASLAESGAGEDTDIFWFDSGDKVALAGAGEGGPQLIMDAVGATNVFADLDGGWADVSWERVIAADPEVIVLGDASWSSAQDKIDLLEKDPALSRLSAVRDAQLVILPYSETTPGVRLADGAQAVADSLADLGRG